MTTISNQKIIKARRDYNTWVATESLEDYALRFAPKSFRKWPEFLVANTAIGGISFLALEAIGGSLAISYGFANSFWAIVVVGAIIFLAGLPISYYAAKYNIDMDLLTRGAGFGYIGSTITSLIYASFTFIFFALEAAIMSQALELYFHLPLPIGYVVCSLIIIPLVFFGVTLINQLQLWTQPIWLTLMILPYIFVLYKEPESFSNWLNFAGNSDSGAAFDPLLFGAAATVSFSLIAQLGEQVDYLRFLPDKQEKNRIQWWLAVIMAGPGWIFLGGAKQLGGAFLASLAISHGVTIAKATEPIQMYLAGFGAMFSNPGVVLAVGTFFVIISQIKINVTNAYAGSLAWSNFFSRLTHSHPGRVVWLVFNVAIALLLMELGVFATLEAVLGLYSNVAIAWVGALVADLVINKPLGLSPSYIEFKRAYLYNINPVGFGSMSIASIVAIAAFVGAFGPVAQAFSPFIALFLAFILAPLIAILTKGKYYIARENIYAQNLKTYSLIKCSICENEYESEDMAFCPVYDGSICSLCCSLDARCHDACKESVGANQHPIINIAQTVFQEKIAPQLGIRIISYLAIFLSISGLVGAILGIIYYQEIFLVPEILPAVSRKLLTAFWESYAALLVLIGIGTWWLVLTQESRQLAQEELDKQNIQLQQEIRERQQVEIALRQSETNLKQAKEVADSANHAKSEFLASMSHELRTPLNGILGYAQILQDSHNLSELELKGINIIYQCGSHLLTLINDILDLSKIEARKMELYLEDFHFPAFLQCVEEICRIRAEQKQISFIYQPLNSLPIGIHADEKRLRQVLINLISNAIKFTKMGGVTFKVSYVEVTEKDVPQFPSCSRQIHRIRFQIEDTGVGISSEQIEKIFLPFEQLGNAKQKAEGTGLGLAISKQIVEMMGSSIQVKSQPGVGSTFWMELDLLAATEWADRPVAIAKNIIGFTGKKRKILVIDDKWENRSILVNLLQPIGFKMIEAANGQEGWDKAVECQPDLVIIDLLMPIMDGFDAIARIRSSPQLRDMVIIASSASVYDTDRHKSLQAGCNDFLPKPIQLENLLSKLQIYLDLEWVYGEVKDEKNEPESSVYRFAVKPQEPLFNLPYSFVAPPTEEVAKLFDLAMKGDLREIDKQAIALEQLDQRFQPFAAQLRQFVKGFQEKEIIELVNQYRGGNK